MKTKLKKTTITLSGALKRRLLRRTHGSRQLARDFLALAVSLSICHFSGELSDSQVEYQADDPGMGALHVSVPEQEYQILVSLRSAGKLSVSLMLSWAISSLLTSGEPCKKWDNYRIYSFSANYHKKPRGWELQMRWRGG